jgi:2-polyprenyl-3-methyl-5-hydroxy-6-metoxy-1,4-benzoquinol methylase
MSLAARSCVHEQMDDPALDPADYALVLRDLALVNRWTLAARPTLAFLQRSLAGRRSFRLLDVGYGQGDMLRAIRRWADARGVSAELVGVDIDPRSKEAALAATPETMQIGFVTGDYRDVPGRFDYVVSSLVAHHMSERELRSFVRFMERNAMRGWLVNDLHRHRFALFAFPLLARAIGVHPIVREDGTLSIARSFRSEDWRRILRQSGLRDGQARLKRYFPFRLCVERLF